MAEYYIYYFVGVIVACGGLIGVTQYIWRRRHAPGARGFMVMMALTTVYTLSIVAAFLCRRPESAYVWFKVRKIASCFNPLGWLYFTLEFGQFRFRRYLWLQIVAWLIPLVMTILMLTNEIHQLVWIMPSFSQLSWPYFFIHYTNGPLNFVPGVYHALVYTLTLGALGLKAPRAPGLYRRQVFFIIVAAMTPGVFNTFRDVFWKAQTSSVPSSPFAFLAMGVILTWGLFRLRLFDLKPVAHETVIQTMSDGVLVLDDRERIIDLNPAMLQIIGRSNLGAVIGQPISAILPTWKGNKTCLSPQATTETDITLAYAEHSRTYNLRLSPLSDQRGRVSGCLIVFRDITAIKEAEATLRNYTVELEASNAELDAFAHTVAHDLKSPLTIVVGFGVLLDERLEHLSADLIHENLQRIVQTGKKMVNIIDELLLLAGLRKISDLATGPVAMDEILAEVRARLESQIQASRSVILIPDAWPAAIGYGPWVEEVWINYIGNAIKYGGRPEDKIPPCIELGWNRVAETNGDDLTGPDKNPPFIRFWVRDNGPGLDADQCAKLFTQFTRLHITRAQGHGLGLSIVQRIISKLGGAVGVESTPGEGSTFWFTLPQAVAPEGAGVE